MKRKWTDEQLIAAVKNNFSIRGVLLEIGLIPAGGSYKVIQQHIKRLKLDDSHFTGVGHLKGKNHNWNPKQPLKDLLILGSNPQSYKLKIRLIKEGLLPDECSRCGISQWQGEKLSLHLDHIDGNNINNQLDNLRLLCPNCHSLTDTYCGKNKKKW